jgi:hypothetical protein
MAVSLNSGTIVNTCDVDNFPTSGSLDNDIFIQGTGAIGEKVSNTTDDFTTSSNSSPETTTNFPYDFSVGGSQEGDHIVIWFNGTTPLNATTGIRISVEDTTGGDTGVWTLAPPDGYSGGWIPRVVDTASDFNSVTGTWTTTGNPAQLTNVEVMGGGFTTITSIMGNINNVLVDQFTIGTGLRADGLGNSWSTIATAENTNYWGWLVESFGSYIVRGGIYLGPETGTAFSTFSDSGAVILFADEQVAQGFYDINIRGSSTTCTFTKHIIRAENPANARWSLTLDGASIPIFVDTSSTFQGFDVMTFRSSSSCNGTTFDNGNSIIQNNGSFTDCVFSGQNTATGVALITSDNPQDFSGCSFTGANGHALEITNTGTYSFSGNTFSAYGADGTNDAAIYNNSGGAVTINITNGGDTPTVRNGAGASTTINNAVDVTISGVTEGTSVQVIADESVGSVTEGDVIGQGLADSTGTYAFSINYEGDLDVTVRCRNQGFPNAGLADDGGSFTNETGANNTAANDDITLLPASAALNDAYLWGHSEKFNGLKLDISTAGSVGFASLTWEFYNGVSWTALSNVTDNTSDYTVSGPNTVTWDAPVGWSTGIFDLVGPFYYVRARQDAASGGGTQPLGRKVKLDVTRYLPFTQNNTITSTGLSVVATWLEDTISTF